MLAEVQAYCLCDVVQTAGVLLRMRLLRGTLDRERFRAAMQGMLTAIEADERLAPATEGMDRERLLREARLIVDTRDALHGLPGDRQKVHGL